MSNNNRNGANGKDKSRSNNSSTNDRSNGRNYSGDRKTNGGRKFSQNKRGNKSRNRSSTTSNGYEAVGSNEKYGGNDISWYSKYPNLLVAAGAFPYPYRPGMSLDLGSGLAFGASKPTPITTDRIPGVMSLNWIPSVGRSLSSTDPASITAKELYARVRAAFSGSLDADAPDFIMYLMALDSVFSYIAWYKRVYRTLNAFSPENYATPDQLLYAYGFSDDEITVMRANKALMWQNINSLVLMSRKFTCPAVMDIFNRHYWLNDNVYTDAASINSQFYVFNQVGFFTYSDVAVPSQPTISASGLKYVRLSHTSGTVINDLYTFGRTLIENLVAWDDAYTISGYLKRAFDGVPTFSVDEISYDQTLEPVFNQEVLLQIENSRAVYSYFDTSYWHDYVVAQEPATNAVISTCEFTTSVSTTGEPVFLQMLGTDEDEIFTQRSDSPTVADNVIASRLHATATWSPDENNAGKYKLIVSAGTEIPLEWNIWVNRSGNFVRRSAVTQVVTFGNITAATYTHEQLRNFAAVTQFDWHPIIRAIAIAGAAPNYTECNIAILGDLHNTTTITKEQLYQLHRICLYSEFNAFQQ